MSSSDQVTINLENLSVDGATIQAGEIEVDGSHTQRHRSQGNHSTEYDASDRHPRRHRRRSRSRSPSPARHQRKNNTTNQVSVRCREPVARPNSFFSNHQPCKLFVSKPHQNERAAPTLGLHDVEPLLITEPIQKVKREFAHQNSHDKNHQLASKRLAI